MRRLVASYYTLTLPEKEFRERIKHLKPESQKRYERDRNWLFKQPSKVHVQYQKKSRKKKAKPKKPKLPEGAAGIPSPAKPKVRLSIKQIYLMRDRRYKKTQLYSFLSEIGKKVIRYERRGVFYSITAKVKTDAFEGYVRTKVYGSLRGLLEASERRFSELFNQPSVKELYFHFVKLYLIPKEYRFRKK